LQPYIENAVKHGVSALKEKGCINVSFRKTREDMIIEVQDNGNGHDHANPQQGYGWKLCEDRIKLLNRLHKEISISLKKKSDINGTLITIMLNNWLPYAGNRN
jgi:LytS/YehU family sensor histidine kinase